MNLKKEIGIWWYCAMNGKHDVSEEDEDQLVKLGLGFYNTKCTRCEEPLTLETIKGDSDHYNVRFEPAE